MKFDLENRVLRFTVSVLKFIETLPDTKICNHLAGQLMRCATAPTLGYGEACAAESAQDFVHKMGVALKELKETRLGLMIIQLAEYSSDPSKLERILNENEQLIAIFGASINTARGKLGK